MLQSNFLLQDGWIIINLLPFDTGPRHLEGLPSIHPLILLSFCNPLKCNILSDLIVCSSEFFCFPLFWPILIQVYKKNSSSLENHHHQLFPISDVWCQPPPLLCVIRTSHYTFIKIVNLDFDASIHVLCLVLQKPNSLQCQLS
jgi:hypothetical protein